MKKFRIEAVYSIVKGFTSETYEIEAETYEEALAILEKDRDENCEIDSIDSDIVVTDTEFLEYQDNTR